MFPITARLGVTYLGELPPPGEALIMSNSSALLYDVRVPGEFQSKVCDSDNDPYDLITYSYINTYPGCLLGGWNSDGRNEARLAVVRIFRFCDSRFLTEREVWIILRPRRHTYSYYCDTSTNPMNSVRVNVRGKLAATIPA